MEQKKRYITVKEFLLLSKSDTFVYIHIKGNGFVELYFTQGICFEEIDWKSEKGYLSFKGSTYSKLREFINLTEETLMKGLIDMYGDSVEISCYVMEDKTTKTLGYFSLIKKRNNWYIIISEDKEKIILSDMSKKLINYLEDSSFLFNQSENDLYEIIDTSIYGIENALELLINNGFEFSPNLNKEFLFEETYEELIERLKNRKEFSINKKQINQTLDESNINNILDKIRLIGIENLPKHEKDILDLYSKQL